MFWIGADSGGSALWITAAFAAKALRAARYEDSICSHSGQSRATRYCFDRIRQIDERPFAYMLLFSLQLLDTMVGENAEARELLDHLRRFVPVDVALPVECGEVHPGELHMVHLARLEKWRWTVSNSSTAADNNLIEPIHPGEILMENFSEGFGITQNKPAVSIGVPPRRINEIVHVKRRITVETAISWARYFGTSEEFWMISQSNYELRLERCALHEKVAAITPLKVAGASVQGAGG